MAQPALPQRAGKHFTKIWTAHKAVQKVSERRPELIDQATSYIMTKHSEQPTKGKVSVRVVTNREIHAEKLALALLATARSRPLDEQERLAAESAKIFKQLNTAGEKRRAA